MVADPLTHLLSDFCDGEQVAWILEETGSLPLLCRVIEERPGNGCVVVRTRPVAIEPANGSDVAASDSVSRVQGQCHGHIQLLSWFMDIMMKSVACVI